MALPSGTVTFLFTDIQGSTELVERLGDAYAGVLEAHRTLLRDTVAAAEGTELDCRGDEFLFVFADAGRAVETAHRAQQALAAHRWPAAGVVEVRMGLHSGEPMVQGSSYVGVDVHRVARIASAAHGGQVLLSARTRELADADARDLGEQQFKGLQAPERVYQLVGGGLREDFPPLRVDGGGRTEASASNGVRMRVVVAED